MTGPRKLTDQTPFTSGGMTGRLGLFILISLLQSVYFFGWGKGFGGAGGVGENVGSVSLIIFIIARWWWSIRFVGLLLRRECGK